MSSSQGLTMVRTDTGLSDSEKTIKKRKYSRAGCEECKRRKMKCDEGKPYCYNCTRLSKTCVYKPSKSAKRSSAAGDDGAKETFPGMSGLSGLTGASASEGQSGLSSGMSGVPMSSGVSSMSSYSSQHIPQVSQISASPGEYGTNFASLVAAANGETNGSRSGTGSGSGGAGGGAKGEPFTVRHYMPNGGYMNNFVSENHLNSNVFNYPSTKTARNVGIPLEELSSKELNSFQENAIEHTLGETELGQTHTLDDSRDIGDRGDIESVDHSAKNKKIGKFSNSISDILTPTENDYMFSEHDLIEMKNLFDEASLLVHDMNDLQGYDLLNFDGPENKIALKKDQMDSPMNYGSAEGSDAGIRSVSDTFEKHRFQVDEFSKEISNNLNNGHYLREYDFNSPHVINVNHLQDIDIVGNSELIEQIIKQHNLMGPHASYLRYLNNKVTSENFFPFASSVENNEVVNILLKYSNNCPYLLSAMLAMIATVEYNVTGKPVHGLSGQKYVSVCLKSLSQAFANSSLNKVNQFLNDIERLLLTVILLTSIFSSKTYKDDDNILNSWKTHLRGAKDLLVNYSVTSKSQSRHSISGGLALARSWFFAIESLAVVTTTFGGTLHKLRSQQSKEEQINGEDPKKDDGKRRFKKSNSVSTLGTDDDLVDNNNRVFIETGYFDKEHNPEYHEALVSVGLLTRKDPGNTTTSEFNLFIGYTVEFVYLIQEYSSCLECLRSIDEKSDYQVPAYRIAKLVPLINEAQSAIIAPKVDLKTFIIPRSSPAHPNYPRLDPDRIELPGCAYGKYLDYTTNETIYYSWFDVSQQCRCDAIYLRLLLTRGLLQIPKDNPMVKELINHILKCFFFILPKSDTVNYEARKASILAETANYYASSDLFDARCYMIQSVVRLVSGLVEDEDSLEKFEAYFIGIMKLGNGSATEALINVRKRRDQLRGRIDVGIDDVVLDITEIVPFS